MKTTMKLGSLLLGATLILTSCTGGGTTESPEKNKEITLASKEEPLSGTIKVSAYETMEYKEFLEEAAQKFMEKHPDTQVEIETQSVMPTIHTQENDDGTTMATAAYEDDPDARSEYITRVSTEIMSGGGADIYAIDELPVQAYIEKNQLEDLTPYMEQDSDFLKEDYQENILEKSKINGSNFVLPLTYNFKYIAYDETLLSAEEIKEVTKGALPLKGLLELKGEKPENEVAPKFLSLDKEYLAYYLVRDMYGVFINEKTKTANFTNGTFVSILEEIDSLEKDGYIPVNKFAELVTEEEQMAFFEQLDNSKYKYKIQESYELLQLLDTNEDNMNFRGYGGDTSNDVFGGLMANNNGETAGNIAQGLVVNANSENKELSWEFLKFLLSEEMQTSGNFMYGGQAINNQARNQRTHDFLSGALWGMPEEMTAEKEMVVKNVNKIVESISDEIEVIDYRNSAVEEMISTGISEYFEGEKTAQEVAESLQSKTTLYLNE